MRRQLSPREQKLQEFAMISGILNDGGQQQTTLPQMTGVMRDMFDMSQQAAMSPAIMERATLENQQLRDMIPLQTQRAALENEALPVATDQNRAQTDRIRQQIEIEPRLRQNQEQALMLEALQTLMNPNFGMSPADQAAFSQNIPGLAPRFAERQATDRRARRAEHAVNMSRMGEAWYTPENIQAASPYFTDEEMLRWGPEAVREPGFLDNLRLAAQDVFKPKPKKQ